MEGFTGIFDMHMHCHVRAGTGSDREMLERMEKIMAVGASYGVTRFNFLGCFAIYDTEEMTRHVNDQTMRITREWPGVVSGFCYINALHGVEASRRELDRCVGEGNLVGVKSELECNPRDPLFRPLAEKAIEYGVPLLQHTWNHTPHVAPGRHGKQREPGSSDVAWLAREYPELTIIMAHLTGCGVRGVLDIVDCPNVVVDTSGAPPVRGIIESAVRLLGPERLLYGSDIEGRCYSTQLGRIIGADLPREVKEAILCQNAARIIPRSKA
jgi:predicted TIM-barrel fold metal-dependent hydrolase